MIKILWTVVGTLSLVNLIMAFAQTPVNSFAGMGWLVALIASIRIIIDVKFK